MRRKSKERIFGTKILVRITKSMEEFCVRSCRARLDAEQKPSKNFASQNSCQESENPLRDFRFHVFGNANEKNVKIFEKK